MKIRVNGDHRELPDKATIAVLLDAIGLNRDGIAVAVNRVVVPRSQHPQHVLADGDKVEVIQAVGGG